MFSFETLAEFPFVVGLCLNAGEVISHGSFPSMACSMRFTKYSKTSTWG